MILAVFALLLLGSGGASSTAAPTTFAQISRQAEQARRANHLPEAIRLYHQAVQLRPNWNEGWWSLGSIHYELDRFSDAQAAFSRYVALDKPVESAYAFLGLCEYETRDYDRARRHLGYWVQKGSHGDARLVAVASFRWAELLTREGRFWESAYLMDSMVDSQAPDPALVEAMGLAWMRMKNVPEDYPSERREMVWLAGSAALSMAAKKFELAHEYMDQLAAYYSQAPNVHFLRGFVYETERRPADAKKEYRQELNLSARHTVAMAKLAVLDVRDGQLDEAHKVASRAVALEPENGQAHYALGRVLLAERKWAEAAHELEIARKLAPNADKVHLYLADAYRKLGLVEKAATETAAFVEEQDRSPRVTDTRKPIVGEIGRPQ